MNCQKYPPSLCFLLTTLGPAFVGWLLQRRGDWDRFAAEYQERIAHYAEQAPHPPEDPAEPTEQDWLEDELPPDDQRGTDWRRVGVIAGFVALIVAIAVFFVWTYLIPTGSQSGL